MIGALPRAERSALLVRLAELLPEGVYRHPLRTELYRTRLRSEPYRRPMQYGSGGGFGFRRLLRKRPASSPTA